MLRIVASSAFGMLDIDHGMGLKQVIFDENLFVNRTWI
jgi:hypothetical protein